MSGYTAPRTVWGPAYVSFPYVVVVACMLMFEGEMDKLRARISLGQVKREAGKVAG